MLAAKPFDNESNASLALQGCRKLVLEDNCPVIGLVGGPTIDASSAFCTEHKVAQNTMATDYSAAKPYVFGGNDANPFGDFCRTLTVRKLHPEAKRVAMLAHDDSVSHQLWPWHKAGYEVGGFEVIRTMGFDSPEDAANSALEEDANVIVICGLDACYPEMAPVTASIVKKKKPDAIVIMAGLPPNDELKKKYEAAGVDQFIHLKSNVLQTLTEIASRLGVTL